MPNATENSWWRWDPSPSFLLRGSDHKFFLSSKSLLASCGLFWVFHGVKHYGSFLFTARCMPFSGNSSPRPAHSGSKVSVNWGKRVTVWNLDLSAWKLGPTSEARGSPSHLFLVLIVSWCISSPLAVHYGCGRLDWWAEMMVLVLEPSLTMTFTSPLSHKIAPWLSCERWEGKF